MSDSLCMYVLTRSYYSARVPEPGSCTFAWVSGRQDLPGSPTGCDGDMAMTLSVDADAGGFMVGDLAGSPNFGPNEWLWSVYIGNLPPGCQVRGWDENCEDVDQAMLANPSFQITGTGQQFDCQFVNHYACMELICQTAPGSAATPVDIGALLQVPPDTVRHGAPGAYVRHMRHAVYKHCVHCWQQHEARCNVLTRLICWLVYCAKVSSIKYSCVMFWMSAAALQPAVLDADPSTLLSIVVSGVGRLVKAVATGLAMAAGAVLTTVALSSRDIATAFVPGTSAHRLYFHRMQCPSVLVCCCSCVTACCSVY